MSVIGQQIKKFRMAKGITQEQLGQLVGVTTQAVSKWERGGTPDAELLPKLSEVLSVSIDTLFEMGDENLALTIARRISTMKDDEAYPFAYNICWAIVHGLMHDVVMPENLTNEYIDRMTYDENNMEYLSKIMRDEGMCIARLSRGVNAFFLMKEPKNSLREFFVDTEAMRKVFEVFADKNILDIIFYMYTRLNTPIATSLISKNTGLSIEKVDECMEKLGKANLVNKSVIETANGEMYSYMFTNENAVIPLLLYADEITKTKMWEYMWSFSRTKPLLK